MKSAGRRRGEAARPRGADPPLGGAGEEGRGRGWGRERGRERTDNGNEGGGNEGETVELRGAWGGCARKGAGCGDGRCGRAPGAELCPRKGVVMAEQGGGPHDGQKAREVLR